MTDNLLLANLAEKLISKAIFNGIIPERDRIYYRNKLFFLLEIPPDYYSYTSEHDNNSISELLELIYQQLDVAKQSNLGITKEQIQTRIINEIIPSPSIIEDKFYHLLQQKNIHAALEWYYQFSKDTDYIKLAAIAKNKYWVSDSKYGQLEITINLSKPEKDPKEIAQAKLQQATNYPKCLLCIENEGYAGNYTHPARQNHRMIRLNLANHEYYLQYSPYLYYNEHSIIINPNHKDMLVDQQMFAAFFDFVDLIPHYLIGSNTDIPIVGGSILTHDHFQAGNHIFPIEKAQVRNQYTLAKFPQVQIQHLNWPISTLKLIGAKDTLIELALLILNKWYNYNNHELGINARSANGQRQNAITPILRKVSHDQYSLYLMLRNNATSIEHPDGIYHPHANLHHIKKENIGLIEAMGLAILPGRLATEVQQIKHALLNNSNVLEDSLAKHQDWFNEIRNKYHHSFDQNLIDNILQIEIAHKFCLVLEDSGVFKDTDEGNKAIVQFIQQIC